MVYWNFACSSWILWNASCMDSVFFTPQKFMLSTDCNTGSPQQIYIYRQRQPNSLFCGNYLRIHSMGAFLLVHTSCAT
jgi:hypothetical protein